MGDKPWCLRANVNVRDNTIGILAIGAVSVLSLGTILWYNFLEETPETIAKRERDYLERERNVVREMIKKYDSDRDGKLGEDEFLRARREGYK